MLAFVFTDFSSCKKENDIYIGYTAASLTDFEGESSCGVALIMGNKIFYPINLPAKYQHASGSSIGNTIYIKYNPLPLNDSFICSNNVTNFRIAINKIEIMEVLE